MKHFIVNYFKDKKLCKLSVSVNSIADIFQAAKKALGPYSLHLLEDGTRIDDNEFLSYVENHTELLICNKAELNHLSVYFLYKQYKKSV